MKRLFAILMPALLVLPLAGCDVDDVFDDIGGFVDKIENFFEDLDDDDDHVFNLTISIGD